MFWCMIPKKPALGLDPRVGPGFPPSRSPLRRAKEGRNAYAQGKSLSHGDLSTADTLGSARKSDIETTTYISAGWIAHGEAAQSHHYLCRYRLDPHAFDVSAYSGDRPGDRRFRHRGGRGGGRDCPSACARPAGRASRSVAASLRAVPQGDQTALERGGEHHYRRCPD